MQCGIGSEPLVCVVGEAGREGFRERETLEMTLQETSQVCQIAGWRKKVSTQTDQHMQSTKALIYRATMRVAESS